MYMILEYQTQGNLNPKIWKGDKIRPKLRVGLLKIAKAFYEFLDVDVNVLDVIIIGSSANYNWTEYSDIDLHVVINYSLVGDNMHLVNNYMHAKKSIWNVNYPLQYKGMNIELYAQDSNQIMHSTVGSYSLMHDKWLRKPNADQVSVDDVAIQQKAQPYEYEIDKLDADDPQCEQKIRSIKSRLQHLRKTGLDTQGEYSIENMAYKHLRNKGYLERLKRLDQSVTMGQLTVEQAATERESINSVPDEVTESLIMHVRGVKRLSPDGWENIIQQTGAVTDPMGQWNHPGKCTMIPTTSGAITMKDVPHRVLGIDDTGHMKMMHPEKQYVFPGKNVFEIPHTAQWQTVIMQLQNAIRNGSRYAQ